MQAVLKLTIFLRCGHIYIYIAPKIELGVAKYILLDVAKYKNIPTNSII